MPMSSLEAAIKRKINISKYLYYTFVWFIQFFLSHHVQCGINSVLVYYKERRWDIGSVSILNLIMTQRNSELQTGCF